jgi:hypothetical protein
LFVQRLGGEYRASFPLALLRMLAGNKPLPDCRDRPLRFFGSI